MNQTVMTGDTLFDNATFWARERNKWLQQAAAPKELTRLQCMHRARQAEYKVIDYGNRAEFAAEHLMLCADRLNQGACA